jgi:hypothetical protein
MGVGFIYWQTGETSIPSQSLHISHAKAEAATVPPAAHGAGCIGQPLLNTAGLAAVTLLRVWSGERQGTGVHTWCQHTHQGGG